MTKIEKAIGAVAVLVLIIAIIAMWNSPIEEYDPCAAQGKTKVVTEYRSGVQYGRYTQLEVYTCK